MKKSSLALGAVLLISIAIIVSAGLAMTGNIVSVRANPECIDNDSDGYGVCPDCGIANGCTYDGDDCNDSNASIHPGVTEFCNSVDDDCDGYTDEYDDPSYGGPRFVGQLCYGIGECGGGKVECKPATNEVDCWSNPGGSHDESQPEICDNKDNDCDGMDDEDFYYDDPVYGEPRYIGQLCYGIGECGGGKVECFNETTASCWTNPGGSHEENTSEICDDLDNDCDNETDELCDEDYDNYCNDSMVTVGNPAVCPNGGGDCNDTNSSIYPGATETCNGVDDDCDGILDGAEYLYGPPCGEENCSGLRMCTDDGKWGNCTTQNDPCGILLCDYLDTACSDYNNIIFKCDWNGTCIDEDYYITCEDNVTYDNGTTVCDVTDILSCIPDEVTFGADLFNITTYTYCGVGTGLCDGTTEEQYDSCLNCSDVAYCSADPPVCIQIIEMYEGWNLISPTLEPVNTSIEAVLADIMDSVIVVNSFEGGPGGGAKTYDPEMPEFSDLHEIDHLHGYWIKVNENVTLSVNGREPGSGINLAEGWNLISYMCDSPKAVEDVFDGILGKVIVINGFEDGAKTYDPELPEFSDLQEMKPGLGYWVKMNESAVLGYSVVC